MEARRHCRPGLPTGRIFQPAAGLEAVTLALLEVPKNCPFHRLFRRRHRPAFKPGPLAGKRSARALPRVAGPAHQLGFEGGQLGVVILRGLRRGRDRRIVIHQRHQGAITNRVVQWHHRANAARRTQARITILLVDLLHHRHAVAQLVQKHLVRIRGDQRRVLRLAVLAQSVQHRLQWFEFRAR